MTSRARPHGTGAAAARLGLALVCAACVVPVAALGDGGTISGARTVTTTVVEGDYDVFTVTPPSGRSIHVRLTVTSGGPVDFYVLDSRQLANYEGSAAWYPDNDAEGSRSWSSLVSSGGTRYLVVDNVNWSESGATPTGPVEYRAEFTEVDNAISAVLGLSLIAIFILVIAAVAYFVIRQQKKAATAPPPPSSPQRPTQGYGPGASPPYSPTTQYPYAQQPAQPYVPQPYYPQPYQPPPYNPPPYPPRSP